MDTNSTNKTISDSNDLTSEKPKARKRGFAAMDRAKVAEIAAKGGKAAHAAGTAHQFTKEEARAAGRKGGVAPHRIRGRGLGKKHLNEVPAEASGE